MSKINEILKDIRTLKAIKCRLEAREERAKGTATVKAKRGIDKTIKSLFEETTNYEIL